MSCASGKHYTSQSNRGEIFQNFLKLIDEAHRNATISSKSQNSPAGMALLQTDCGGSITALS